jgi:SAM-dependent methyltransferase
METSFTDRPTGDQTECPSCFSTEGFAFHAADDVPVNSVLNVRSREEALRFPTGDICLRFCVTCGFIWNSLFDPERTKYSTDCEESQGYSPTFNEFARKLASDLVEKYRLYHKEIIEIGCGKGEFLALLCELGENRGIGFDPAFVEGRTDLVHQKGEVAFVKDYYSEKYADYSGEFICCRMTLEHIPNTGRFLEMVRRSIGNRSETVVFFQVPDVTRILEGCAFEDIYYEHCSYFSPGSLARLFRAHDFDVLDLRTEYKGQYLLIEATPSPSTGSGSKLDLEDDQEQMKAYVTEFNATTRTS